jgi:hypothetical protein
MLRLLLLLLLLANAVWFGWSQGWLPAGLIPWPRDADQREPQRLALQVHPERLQILPAGQPRQAVVTSCWQAGPFKPGAQGTMDAIEPAMALAGLPATAWQRVEADDGTWLRVPAATEAQQAALRGLVLASPADLGAPASPGAGTDLLAFKPCE